MFSENKHISPFPKHFKNGRECFEFLVYCKWGKGYRCRRCGNEKYSIGKKWHHRRCTKCRYDESATARTLFHKIKFPLMKAFLMTNDLVLHPEGFSSCQLARNYGVCQETAWFFKRKVQQAMTRFGTRSFVCAKDGVLNLRHGRNLHRKMLLESQINRATRISVISGLNPFTNKSLVHFGEAKSIEVFKINELTEIELKLCREEHRMARGDAWQERMVLDVAKEEDLVLQYAVKIKSWIKSTHHHVSKRHLFYYCGEFNYRYWRSKEVDLGFFELLQAMVKHPWLRYQKFVAT